MSKITVLFVIFAFLLSVSVMAEVKNDMMYIPKTSVAPVIDGALDDVYKMTSEVLGVIEDPLDATPIDDWTDCFGNAYLLWDDTNLYMYLNVQDELINAAGGDYNYDGVELYFDGDQSKGETYDGLDDIQLRFNVGEVETNLIDTGYGSPAATWDIGAFDPSVFDFFIEETDLGWVLEFALPFLDMQLAPGAAFGFDFQINDADLSTREHMLRWWQDAENANDEWRNPSLFGDALMRTDRIVSDVLDIPQTSAAPTIDGAMAAGEWDASWQISGNVFDSGLTDVFAEVWDWTDMRFTANLMWDPDNLYIYVKTLDDVINTGADYNYDGIEIYFDADNSKLTTYDTQDDLQLRLNVGESTTDEIEAGYGTSGASWFDRSGISYVVEETDLGWDLEVALPITDLQLAAGYEFGFDMQLNDADDATRGNNMIRWWSDSNNEWQNASYFGTAKLVAGTAVEDKTPNAVSTFELQQNYPNPFNPTTNITYSVARTGQVTLTVYNLVGEQVAALVNEVQPAGSYTVPFNAATLPSGLYLYTLQTDGQTATNKMMLMK